MFLVCTYKVFTHKKVRFERQFWVLWVKIMVGVIDSLILAEYLTN